MPTQYNRLFYYFILVAMMLMPRVAQAASPVKNLDSKQPQQGLSGRVLALWNSHGAYYNADKGRWIFQRAPLNTTVEDVYTSSYIIDLLIPMLENAGAYVMIPRERDTSDVEVIVDADSPSTPGYNESGVWQDGGVGYGYSGRSIAEGINPMNGGSARVASKGASASWHINVPHDGTYVLYVTYPRIDNATTDARYTIKSGGREQHFSVDQTMGAGTWMYLGEFFVDATDGLTVTLTGGDKSSGKIVADAVKLGGGMGTIEREGQCSGYRRWTEGARYWLQYAGAPVSVYSPEESDTDYGDDIRCRPNWVNWISGGSVKNPRMPGLNIPVDLSLALHTDAGVTPDTTIIGTLGIYCTDSGSKLGDGSSRKRSKALTESVVNSIVDDLRQLYQADWTKRKIRDGRYIEARYPAVPSTLIELLSHQNYADMTLGLDPQFRFDAARAIYKGILRYLRSGTKESPIVQPLPVNSLALQTTGDSRCRLSWLPTIDPLETSARPDTYIIERRKGATGTFEPIATTSDTSITLDAPIGSMMSYRVVAANDGGVSFPSEVVVTAQFENDKPEVLIVNGFTRVSGPEQFDDGTEAGFIVGNDGGVPYRRNIAYIGEQYDFDRSSEWISDDTHPGHGASYLDNVGRAVAGNTFDYAAIHGDAMTQAEQPFVSMSLDGYLRLESEGECHQPVIDLILGKQREVTRGNVDGTRRFKAFPDTLQTALRRHAYRGGALLVSGSYVASDLIANRFSNDSTEVADREFARDILGIDLVGEYGATSGKVTLDGWWANGRRHTDVTYPPMPNERVYAVESPDAIASTRQGAHTIARYAENQLPAAVVVPRSSTGSKTIIYGFPLETVFDRNALSSIMEAALLHLLPWKIESVKPSNQVGPLHRLVPVPDPLMVTAPEHPAMSHGIAHALYHKK